MLILHPTDFSDASRLAGRAAAQIARAWNVPLHVLHVAHLPGVSAGTAAMSIAPSADELARRRAALEGAAAELRGLGVEVIEELCEGLVDEKIVERIESSNAALVVIGPTGDNRRVAFGLGSTAMRLVKAAKAPTLVAREHASLAAWAKGERPLRVAIGLDPSRPSRVALNWLGSWSAAGPLEVVAIHVYDPDTLAGAGAVAEKAQFLLDDLKKRLGAEVRVKQPRARLAAGGGHVTPHLLDACASEQADLIVVGTHRYTAFDRILRGSTSLDIISASTRNVVAVPVGAGDGLRRESPTRIERVLVPVDFSEASRSALPWACTLLAQGGQLQLLHVCTVVEGDRPTQLVSRAHEELEAIDPATWGRPDLTVRREVVVANHVAKHIVSTANEWESDLICLASHGRSALSRVLMGSVAQGVLGRTDRPVITVPALPGR